MLRWWKLVEAGLNAVYPYDWHGFIEDRIYKVKEAPPMEGIEAAGWRLVYTDVPNADKFAAGRVRQEGNQSASIGITVRNDGTIDDVMTGVRERIEAFIDWAWDYFSRNRPIQVLNRNDDNRINWEQGVPAGSATVSRPAKSSR